MKQGPNTLVLLQPLDDPPIRTTISPSSVAGFHLGCFPCTQRAMRYRLDITRHGFGVGEGRTHGEWGDELRARVCTARLALMVHAWLLHRSGGACSTQFNTLLERHGRQYSGATAPISGWQRAPEQHRAHCTNHSEHCGGCMLCMLLALTRRATAGELTAFRPAWLPNMPRRGTWAPDGQLGHLGNYRQDEGGTFSTRWE